MAITLPDDKPVQVKVSWVDAHQNLGVVDGSTVWASSDEAQVIATPDPTDSTLATLTSPAGGAVNITAQVTATADSDLGSGVVPVIAMVDVTVVAGTVVAGTISPVPAPGP